MAAPPLPCLALVTDRHVSGGTEPLLHAIDAALAGGAGVQVVLLREKDMPQAERLDLAGRLRALTQGRALLFVNDSVEAALACGADGVQLGEASRSIAGARRAMDGTPMLIGRSVHDLAGAAEAADAGADLLVAGAVFPTLTHPGAPPAGPELIERIAATVSVPVLGIGGITAANAAQVIGAGASGVAVVREILAQDDPASAAQRLRTAVDEAWAARARPQAQPRARHEAPRP